MYLNYITFLLVRLLSPPRHVPCSITLPPDAIQSVSIHLSVSDSPRRSLSHLHLKRERAFLST